MPRSEYEFKTESSVWDEHVSMNGLEKMLEKNYRNDEWKNRVQTIFQKIDFNFLRDYLKTKLTQRQWIDESDLIDIYKKSFTKSGGDSSILAFGWMNESMQYYPHHVIALLLSKVQKNWKWYGDQGGIFIQDSDTKTQTWIKKPFSRPDPNWIIY